MLLPVPVPAAQHPALIERIANGAHHLPAGDAVHSRESALPTLRRCKVPQRSGSSGAGARPASARAALPPDPSVSRLLRISPLARSCSPVNCRRRHASRRARNSLKTSRSPQLLSRSRRSSARAHQLGGALAAREGQVVCASASARWLSGRVFSIPRQLFEAEA
jgi:hypothetical protein